MPITYFFLLFIIYSFIGWFYESTICSLSKYHKLINRGCLTGPYCPIYGTGAIVNIILLQNVNSILGIFVVAALTSVVIEYVTSYTMEKLFEARWWDYSHYRLNINGRVCFRVMVIFGVGNVLLLKVIHPEISKLVNHLSSNMIYSISLLLMILFITDLVLTTIGLTQFTSKLKLIYSELYHKRNNSVISKEELTKVIKENIKMLKKRYTRILHAFPRFKSKRFGKILKRLKDMLDEM